MSLAKGLSILFIYSNNQLLVLLIFIIVLFISFSFISARIFMISFLLIFVVAVLLLFPVFLGVKLGCLFSVFLVWKEWCWSWNSSTWATSYEELTHCKRHWCWEGLRAGGEGDDRGWDGWMVSPTRWISVGLNSGSWWWTGRPGVLHFMGSQRVGYK